MAGSGMRCMSAHASALAQKLMHPDNVEFIRISIEKKLQTLFHCPVTVAASDDLFLRLSTALQNNPTLHELHLNALNQDLIARAVADYRLTLSARARYVKYALNEEYPKFFPYPQYEKPSRGVVCTENRYPLQSPWRHRYGQFLQDVLR